MPLAPGSSFTAIGRLGLSSQSPSLAPPLPLGQATSAGPGKADVDEDRCGGFGVGPTHASVGGEPRTAALVRAGCVSAASRRSGFVDTVAAAATDAGADRPGPASKRTLFPSPDESDTVLLLWPRSASASRSSRARPGLVAAMLARVRPASASSWARSCRRNPQCEFQQNLLSSSIPAKKSDRLSGPGGGQERTASEGLPPANRCDGRRLGLTGTGQDSAAPPRRTPPASPAALCDKSPAPGRESI